MENSVFDMKAHGGSEVIGHTQASSVMHAKAKTQSNWMKEWALSEAGRHRTL